jgi:hypothetical protein
MAHLKRSVCWIKDECDHTPYLREHGLTLLSELKLSGEPDVAQLRDKIGAITDSYYAWLWSTLTTRERLVLYQLGKDGWANPQNEQAVRQLQCKGLLSGRPGHRIMNQSFRLFAMKAQDEKEIGEWERQAKESSWRTLKFSLITAAVTLAAWLLYVQKDLFQSAIGYVVTIGAALTAVTNLVGAVRVRSGPAATAPDSSEK